MTLPPTIEAILKKYGSVPSPYLVQDIVLEACRLQREADNEAIRRIQIRHSDGSGRMVLTGPLVAEAKK